MLEKVQRKIEKHKDALAQTSHIANYWIQYLPYINILNLFIQAEQNENWEVHLLVLQKMLKFFTATGHINYVKKCTFTPAKYAKILRNTYDIEFVEVTNIVQVFGVIQ